MFFTTFRKIPVGEFVNQIMKKFWPNLGMIHSVTMNTVNELVMPRLPRLSPISCLKNPCQAEFWFTMDLKKSFFVKSYLLYLKKLLQMVLGSHSTTGAKRV